jgi:hypothetical protein
MNVAVDKFIRWTTLMPTVVMTTEKTTLAVYRAEVFFVLEKAFVSSPVGCLSSRGLFCSREGFCVQSRWLFIVYVVWFGVESKT